MTYDVRPDSPSRDEICKLALTDRDHFIINIPAHVWHATRTLGSADAIIVNFPTAPYDHANPDKQRLPLATPLIPYSFGDTPGW